MSRESFIDHKFGTAALEIIAQANAISAEFVAKGFASLTLRQMYYQFVARDMLRNKVSEYKRLGDILNTARLSGCFDWAAMEDRTRNVQRPAAWKSPASILSAVAGQYQEDPWRSQVYAPEVWVEKDALIGVIEPVCERMRVPYFACRGNVSQSESYSAGVRMRSYNQNRIPIVFHLGDHDPNGLDMTRDNRDRLSQFAGRPVKVVRLALNMDQVEEYAPPPNPAKETDSRYAKYAEEFGDESWELDALSPEVIDSLIQDALDDLIDRRAWDASMAHEAAGRELLEQTSNYWPGVQEYLKGLT